ncbi:imelysin family protein [Microvirga sp. ACRRW]|uniref:imelysin family protein n=1 Tax=Microvirga sp. ACRRW TaxID=2918205 RepID=UPI001EF4858C|nr:imelysin family protein [Microvirga sp. ACRRW]MCG7391631.1 imelysin family protein [Microvirga sp. ACRRW]
MRLLAAMGFLLAFALGAPANAADHRQVALRAAREFALPRYEALAEATSSQAAAWNDACRSKTPRDLKALDAAFHAAADAWAQVEFVRYGPIGEEFRFERMEHWPERRNAVSRALSNLISRPDAEILSPERFQETSVAGQGFSALERLLFEEETRNGLRSSAPASERLCQVGKAIATALATTSRKVSDEWRQKTLPMLEQADEARAREAVTRLVTDLLTALEVVEDFKLVGPLGPSIDATRPTTAEMWRSGRSTRAIHLNLEAAGALTRALLGPNPGDEGQGALDAIESAASISENAPEDLRKAVADPRGRTKIILLRDAVSSARTIATAGLPPSLEITTGFNSLDGD